MIPHEKFNSVLPMARNSRSHVFISYAREDAEDAALLNEFLKAFGVVTWIDYERLLPGFSWKRVIRDAIRDARAVLFLSSKHSVNKKGFVQREVKDILDKLRDYPAGSIVLLVVRLDDTEPKDEAFQEIQWADLFSEPEAARAKILQVLNVNADQDAQQEELKPDREGRVKLDAEREKVRSEMRDAIPKATKETSEYTPAPQTSGRLFSPEELDIYVNKSTIETYIFHGKDVDYESIDYLEYHYQDHWVAVILASGERLDLGVKIQWLVRPYWEQAEEVNIVRTMNRKSIDGTVVLLRKLGRRPRVRGASKNISSAHGLLRFQLVKKLFKIFSR